MAKHASRNELARKGVTYRELRLPSKASSGFVIRLLDRNTEPAIITTVVQQPGQSNVAVETVSSYRTVYPTSFDRFYDSLPTEQRTLEDAVSQLEESNHPLAKLALHRIEISAAE